MSKNMTIIQYRAGQRGLRQKGRLTSKIRVSTKKREAQSVQVWEHHPTAGLVDYTRSNHEEKTLCRNIEETSQDRKLSQMGLQAEKDPNHSAILVVKCQKCVFCEAIIKPWCQSDRGCGLSWKGEWEQGRLQTWLSYSSSVSRNGSELLEET